MKTNIVLFVSFSLLFLGPVAFAQDTSIGLKGSIGAAQISPVGNSAGSMVGLRLGGFLTHSVSADFGVGAEVNFARKGGPLSSNGEPIQLDYLEIPVMAYYFFGKKGFRPKLFGGPYYGYLIQAQQNGQELNNYAQQDYGLTLGLGLHYSLGNRRWFYIDVRYSYGLETIRANTDQNNRDLSLHLGVSFPLTLPLN